MLILAPDLVVLSGDLSDLSPIEMTFSDDLSSIYGSRKLGTDEVDLWQMTHKSANKRSYTYAVVRAD